MEPKIRSRFRKNHKFDPISLPIDIKENEEDYYDLEEETKPATIIEKLRSYDAKAREIATSSLAQINELDPDIIEHIVKQGCLPILIERLSDPNIQVVANSLMALKNINDSDVKIDGKHISMKIIDAGVIILLETLLANYQNNIASLVGTNPSIHNEENEESLKTTNSIIEFIFKLLSSLAENLDQSLLSVLFNSAKIGVKLLLSSSFMKIITGVLSFLHVLTEASEEVALTIAQTKEVCLRLLEILDHKAASQEIKAYACGILFNVISVIDQRINNMQMNCEWIYNQDIVKKVVEVLWNIASIKIFDEIGNLKKIWELNIKKNEKKPNDHDGIQDDIEEDNTNTNNNNNNIHEEEEEKKEPEEHFNPECNIRIREALKIWNDSALAIELALGTLVVIFEDGSKDDDNDEKDYEDIDEVEEEGDMISSSSTMKNDSGNNNTGNLPKGSFFNILSSNIGEKFIGSIIEKCSHLSDDYITFLNQAQLKEVIDHVSSITHFSMSFLMNLCVNFIIKDNSNTQVFGFDKLKVLAELLNFLWTECKYYSEFLYKEIVHYQADDNKEENFNDEKDQLHRIIEFMLLICQNSGANINQIIPANELLQAIIIIFPHLEKDTKLIVIELLGARMHPKNNITMQENSMCADFIMELLKNDDVEIIGEGLNALFDIYSDETYDTIFKEKGFMMILNHGYDLFRAKIKESKPKLKKSKITLLNNHALNLKRFLQYKAVHIQ